MPSGITTFARRHPSLFSGAWFGGCVLLLAAPAGAILLLFVGLEALGGRHVGGQAWAVLASVGLLLVPAFGVGAAMGPRIVRLSAGERGRAAAWGAAIGLGSLLCWSLLLEVLNRLPVRPAPVAGGGGDVPGAAVVVGYFVVLPAILLLSVAAGAVAGGLLLWVVKRGGARGATDPQAPRTLPT